jgi:hypothetical protein
LFWRRGGGGHCDVDGLGELVCDAAEALLESAGVVVWSSMVGALSVDGGGGVVSLPEGGEFVGGGGSLGDFWGSVGVECAVVVCVFLLATARVGPGGDHGALGGDLGDGDRFLSALDPRRGAAASVSRLGEFRRGVERDDLADEWVRRPGRVGRGEGGKAWGKLEGWKAGRLEGWKAGRLEGWKAEKGEAGLATKRHKEARKRGRFLTRLRSPASARHAGGNGGN